MNFKNKVVYEIYIKSFNDSTGSGKGDIQGIIKKFDYLKSLGVNALWITPFYASPMKDEGYDISNYTQVNPNFGNFQDVELLIAKCRENNIDFMADFVLNHTSSEHKWFQKALDGEEEYQKYYFFFDEPKTNWIGRFGGSCWEYVPKLKKYYLHLYDKTQPDLNWDNPIVRQKMFEIVDFWLSKGINAYKLDVLYLISKPTDDWQPNGKIHCAEAVRDGKNVHKYIKEFMSKIKSKHPNTYSIGEMSFSTLKECIKYSNAQNNEVDIIQTSKACNASITPQSSDKIMRDIKTDMNVYISTIKKWVQGMHDNNGWMCNFTANHDSSRTINKFGNKKFWEESSKAHIMNIAFLWGTPFFHMGQEIGMLNPDYEDVHDYKDIKSIHAIKEFSKKGYLLDQIKEKIAINGRDPGRNPMIWNENKNGGWSTSNNPWRKTPKWLLQKVNVQNQENNPYSILSFFKKTVKIRSFNKVLINGDIKFIDAPNNILFYKRSFQNKIIYCIFNFSSSQRKMNLDFNFKNIIHSNYQSTQIQDKVLNLKPWEAIAIKT